MDKGVSASLHHHCEPPCGLGSLEYQCPNCLKQVTDYGPAAVKAASFEEGPIITSCPKCKTELLLEIE